MAETSLFTKFAKYNDVIDRILYIFQHFESLFDLLRNLKARVRDYIVTLESKLLISDVFKIHFFSISGFKVCLI